MGRPSGGLFAVLLLSAGCSATDSPGPHTFLGQGSDPSGDGGVADLVSAVFEIAGTSFTVRAQTTAATFNADSLLITFNVDTDGNAATGYTTTNPGHVGLGIDCLIELGKVAPTLRAARVQRWQGIAFAPVATAAVTVISNGYEATLPLNACPELASGDAVFRVDAFRQLSALSYTIRQDWLPDPTLAPLQLR
jgi:hypothetical protein